MMLRDRTAVVTGAAAGIGNRIAARFAAEGANVIMADIDSDSIERVAGKLCGVGHAAVGVECDVTDETSVTALFDRCAVEFGAPDVMVNNAGITRDAVLRKMTVDNFLDVMNVHVLGAWLGIRAATQRMRAAGVSGSIINMSSISGKVGNPGQSNYSAAKAGIVGLTKAAAKEVARYGIRVNCIQPGLIETAMARKVPADVLAEQIRNVPLGRIGTTDDVAGVALFLAGELSSYVTGTAIEVTGGRHM